MNDQKYLPSSIMAQEQSAGNIEQIEISRLMRNLYRKRWFIITVTAVAMTVSMIYAFSIPDQFTGISKILIDEINDKPTQFSEQLLPKGDSGTTYYETQVALIQSRDILEKSAAELNLATHYQKLYKGIKTDRQAARLLKRKNIKAKVARGTQIMEISVKDTDPKMAADLANTVANNFVKESLKSRLFVSDQILQWFPDEARTLKDSGFMGQLSKLSDKEITSSLPSIMKDPVVNQIKKEQVDLDAQIREFSRRYTDEHPKMKELRAKAAYLNSEMKSQTEKILTGLKANLAGAFNVTNIRVVETAIPPSGPSGPPRALIIIVCSILGFSISSMVSIAIANMENNIRSEEDVQKIPMAFLGYVPLIESIAKKIGHKSSKNLIECLAQDTGIVDEVANIRSAIYFSLPAERSKIIMCTSAIPEEGKTTISSLIALSVANYGERVILIDSDMRNPSVHKKFDIANEVGLSNCLVGSVTPEEVIIEMENIAGLHIITAGQRTPNPGMLLNSDSIRNFFSVLKRKYDRIIVDVPPALHIPDAFILSQYVDATIFVFGADMTHISAAKKLKDRFSVSGAAIVGAVINRAVYKNLDNYYNYSYYRYYDRYRKYYKQSHEPLDDSIPQEV